MKILILSTSFPRKKGDYIAPFFLEIAKRLTKKYGVEGIAPHCKGYLEEETLEKVKIRRFKYMPFRFLERIAYGNGMRNNVKKWYNKLILPFFMLGFLIKTVKTVKKGDIIIANFLPSAFIGLIIKKLFKTPVILTVHRDDNSLPNFISKRIFKKVDFVIFNSNYTKNKIISKFNLKNYKVIYVGVNVSKFNLPKKENKKIKLISIGRLIEKKGYFDLIKAISIVNKNFDVELDIIGWGGLKNEIGEYIKKLNIKNINLLGAIHPEDIPQHLANSDIFVLPSIVDSNGETETLGVVFLEAMSCGLPVIGTNVGGIPDVIKNNKNGFLIEPHNPQQLADKIIKLIKNKSLRKNMGEESLKIAKKVFDWDNLINDYFKIIEDESFIH